MSALGLWFRVEDFGKATLSGFEAIALSRNDRDTNRKNRNTNSNSSNI